MSYQSEVLADNPLVYLRLDESGAATNGQTIADLGSEELGGTLTFPTNADGFQPFGYASAVETDPDSRALMARTVQLASDGTPFGYNKSYVEVPDDASLDLNDVAIEVWFRQADFNYYGSFLNAVYTLVTKTGAYGIGVSVEQLPALGVGFLEPVFWVYDAGGVFHSVQATGYRLLPGAWYHLVGRRVGSSVSIDINGHLINSVSIPGTATRVNSNALIVGSIQTVANAAILDEVAVYSSLSTARGLVHYEAAKSSLSASWTSLTQFTLEIDTGSPAPEFWPFLHNFGEVTSGRQSPVKEFLSYSTGVAQAEADFQQRNDRQPYHVERAFENHITPVGVRAKQIFDATLFQPGRVYVKPVEIGWTVLTAQADPGDQVLVCDTTLREFSVGGWLGCASDPYDPTTYQFFRASAVSDTDVDTLEEVTETLPVGSPVFPCRLCVLVDEPDLNSLTADRIDARFRFEALSTENPTRHVTAYSPAVTYKGLEVYDRTVTRVPWLGDGGRLQTFGRQGLTGIRGGNDYVRGVDTGTVRSIPLRFTLEGRTELAGFRGWLDAHRGKALPFWLASDEEDLTYSSRPNTTHIVVEGHSYAESYNLHHAKRDIRVTYTDGSVTYQRITGVVDNGDGNDKLTVSPSLTALKTVRDLCFISQVVLLADMIELTHNRNGSDFISECDLSVRELLTSP